MGLQCWALEKRGVSWGDIEALTQIILGQDKRLTLAISSVAGGLGRVSSLTGKAKCLLWKVLRAGKFLYCKEQNIMTQGSLPLWFCSGTEIMENPCSPTVVRLPPAWAAAGVWVYSCSAHSPLCLGRPEFSNTQDIALAFWGRQVVA